jgi:hypothetical protein
MAMLQGAAACSLDLGYLQAGGGSPDAGPDVDPGFLDGMLGDESFPADASMAPDTTTGPSPDTGTPDSTVDATAETGPVDAASEKAVPDAYVAPCSAGSAPGNLVANWSFECGFSSWSVQGSGTSTVTTTQAHSGTHSVVISGRTQNYNGPAQDLTSLMIPGQGYNVSAWGMILNEDDAGDPEIIKMTLKSQCSSDDGATYTQIGNTTAAIVGSWVQVGGAVSAPNCTTPIQMLIYVEGPDAGIDLYVDDVTVTQ